MIPGEIRAAPGEIELNAGRAARTLLVANTGDRPVQVGSHLHLADANPCLRMDRESAFGHRLDIPAGSSLRFLPGDEKEVRTVPFGGPGRVPGIQRGKDAAADGAGERR